MWSSADLKCLFVFLLTSSCLDGVAPTQITLPPIQHFQIEEILERAHDRMDEVYREFDINIYKRGTRQVPGSPAWYMATSHLMKPSVYNITHTSFVVEEATRNLANMYALSKEQISFALSEMDVSRTRMGKTCPMTIDPPCKPKKYRSFSGYCNNVQNPRWGSTNSKYSRLLPPAYDDGVSVPRGTGTLPSSREISLAVHTDDDSAHEHLTAIIVAWGQFVAHDISHTPLVSGYSGARIKCCGVNFEEFHPECFPIKLPPADRKHRDRCQEFVRSAGALRAGCSLGPREQLNQATAFLDASAVYGSSKDEANALREFRRGRMATQAVRGHDLMPGTDADCRTDEQKHQCFLSGDVRANENIGLATLHTLIIREHNRVAGQLESINKHWNDETIFQETRKIVAAEIQHITYNEFLPMILSQNVMDVHGLTLDKNGFFDGYNINRNPSVINSASHAAMWFVATLMPRILKLSKTENQNLNLPETFYAPFELYQRNGFDTLLQGLLKSSTQKDDPVINYDMMNNMFKDDKYTGHGLDLAAQIIQRGRDHGLPAYTEWRRFCGLGDIKTFDDLEGVVPEKMIEIFEKLYRNVTDLDLFTGALSEFSVLGSVVGPTFSCLLAHQFKITKTSDRFWYENNIPPSSFNLEQLTEIRKTTLARLICDNSKTNSIQTNVFVKPDEYLNSKMPCAKKVIKKMDLTKWSHDSSQIILDLKILKSIVEEANREMEKMFEDEYNSIAGLDTPMGTSYKFNRPKRQAALIANTSLLLQLASAKIADNYIENFQEQNANIKNKRGEEFQLLMTALPEVDLSDILHIPKTFLCDEQASPCDYSSPFRSITGRCNNLKSPEYGKSMRSFNRILTPEYDDGIGSPRQTSVTGKRLPSARLISTKIHPDISAPHERYSLMLMQLAQILDHDLTHTPVNIKHVGPGILNCSPCKTTPSGCIPIPIPPNDPFYPDTDPNTNQPKCIPVTRSLPSRLTLGYREQMNQVTAYIDCSFIYGSDVCEAKQLRMFVGGKLNVTNRPNTKPLMPEQITNPECRSDSKLCFRAGDARASEQPGLASLHTIFLRKHNRIAETLSSINRHWNDEEIYQQTRRIVSAIMQHLIFSELLPRVFGWEHLQKYGLALETNGYFKRYNPECDATLVNEFSAAAYRFGHSLLRPVLKRVNNKYENQEPSVRLRDHFFNPHLLYNKNMLDELVLGLTSTPMETLDRFITYEVTNHLFEDKNIEFSGIDLPATNIQRGRDHGIPGYNKYREFCNLTKASNFDDFQNTISHPSIKDLKQLYAHVDDVDLFPGGLTEIPLTGGIIGPTFACIIGNQMKRLRECDRFWYENDNHFTRFTPDQLTEIRKSTLAQLICENGNDIITVQKSVLDMPEPFLNPRVPCSSLTEINLKHWKEQRRCIVKGIIIEEGTHEKISPCVMCVCTKEGVICESMKIDDCSSLKKSHSWDNILEDSVCKVQCAHMFSEDFNNTTYLGFT